MIVMKRASPGGISEWETALRGIYGLLKRYLLNAHSMAISDA
jgi:hypothetical protein